MARGLHQPAASARCERRPLPLWRAAKASSRRRAPPPLAGLRRKLKLIHTAAKGWGVFTPDEIGKGEFVIEYCGELITEDEASRRAAKCPDSEAYQFVLPRSGVGGNTASSKRADPGMVIDGYSVRSLPPLLIPLGQATWAPCASAKTHRALGTCVSGAEPGALYQLLVQA